MNLKQYIKTRKCHEKEVVIYDTLHDGLKLWRDPIIIDENKNGVFCHGWHSNSMIDRNHWLWEDYGHRKIDVIHNDDVQIMIELV